jgi:hypothetical protein
MCLEPEIHRVDPESGPTLNKALIEIFSQTAGSTCEFWANPVNFTSTCLGRRAQGAGAHGDGPGDVLRAGANL